MKLYELPRNTKFKIVSWDGGGVFTLEKIDGMYSICWKDNLVYHISACAEVEPVVTCNRCGAQGFTPTDTGCFFCDGRAAEEL